MTSGLRIFFLISLSLSYIAPVMAEESQESAHVDSNNYVAASNLKKTQFSPSTPLKTNRTRITHDLFKGFYPLVEDTGYVTAKHALQLGFQQIGYTALENVTFSTQPMLYFAHTPNAMVKAQLYKNNQHAVAFSGSINVMQPNTDDFFSPFYSSRIYNPNSSLYVVPIAIAHSYRINNHIIFHQTLTDINVYARTDFKTKANVGYSGVLQLKARDRHSIMIHASEMGFWNHDYYFYGVSYRYASKEFFTQFGYFNRVQPEGVQGIPLFDIGFVL